ncbi:MAG: glycosyltransferase family 39 protein [Candidatus Levybacteria bacterium]|nr:glycosyltransferase family 39 protein [Candidatus Levybacteria bacterium]
MKKTQSREVDKNLIRQLTDQIIKNWLIAAILIAAAFLRIYRIDGYMTFLGDEGRDALIVYNILHGRLTFLGPTASVGGFFMGPIYYYFMAPFLLLFNYNPVGPAVMVALFGVATVFLIYKVGSEFFNKKTGFIACTLYAVSPLVIGYSRSSWNPNLMPFFSLITIYIFYKAVKSNKNKYFILCGILYGIAIQLHYIELFLGVAIFLYIPIIRFFSKEFFRIIKDYVYIFIGFVIGWSPFLTFEIRHSFPNIRSIINFVFNSGETGGNSHFLDNVGNVFFRLFGRLLTNFPPPEQVNIGIHPNIAVWYYLTILLAVLTISIFLFQCFKTLKQRSNEFLKLSLLFLWFFIGILLFGFYKKPIYDYYFEFMFPLPFLLVGNGLSFLFSKGKVFKVISIVSFLVLLAINLNAMPFKSEPNNQRGQVKKIALFVLDKTNGKPFNFALITLGNSDHAYRYFMKLEKRDPVVIENTQNDPQKKTITDQLLIVCEDPNCKPLGNPLWEVAGFGRAEIAGEWGVSVVKVYKLVHYKGK